MSVCFNRGSRLLPVFVMTAVFVFFSRLLEAIKCNCHSYRLGLEIRCLNKVVHWRYTISTLIRLSNILILSVFLLSICKRAVCYKSCRAAEHRCHCCSNYHIFGIYLSSERKLYLSILSNKRLLLISDIFSIRATKR